MARHPRKAKSAAKPIIDNYSSEESEVPESIEEGIRDFLKEIKPEVEAAVGEDEDEDSPASDFEGMGKKRKKAPTKRRAAIKKFKLNGRRKREPSPDVPVMSDDEYEEERADDVPLLEKPQKPLQQGTKAANVKFTPLPNTVRIEIPPGLTTINLNLRDLLRSQTGQQAVDQDLDGSTLLETSVEGADTQFPQVERAKTPESFADMRANPKYACFLELEADIRNRIYRELLVKREAVKFNPSPDLSRTAAILRTNRQIYQEASGILYGENSFHLDRTEKPRGTLYTTWREVGYKDMRRFLETIGTHNVAKIRYLSISLSDAIPVYSPELTPFERRYQNDPVLYHIFKMIGNSDAVFEKLVVNFGGRGALDLDNGPFLRAFTTLKCHQLTKVCRWHHSRISTILFPKMKEFMEVPMPADVDPDKRREPVMHHQQGDGSYLGCPSQCSNSRYYR